jgi:prohibitin 1
MNVKLVTFLCGIFILVLVVISSLPFAFVGAGERGVIFNNTSGTEDRILGEGIHFRIPFVQSVKTLSVQILRNDVKAEAASKDLQTVTTDIAVNWRLDPLRVNKVYQSMGTDDEKVLFERIVIPAVNEVVKAATSELTAEEVVAKRPILKEKIDTELTKRLADYNVILEDVSIVNVDFSPAFNAAIEAKSVSVQDALKAENDLRRIKVEAEQKITTARAEAESIKIQTEALNQNQNLIALRKAEALKISAEKGVKIVPDTIIGGDSDVLFSIK